MTPAAMALAGTPALLDPAGVVFLPVTRTLVVADLHLEKGSAFARRGTLLPPYDTAATLKRLEAAVARLEPSTVVSLGDAFHDGDGPAGLGDALARRIGALIASVGRWVWVRGNHDPQPPVHLGGEAVDGLKVAGLGFGHMPGAAGTAWIAGHLHPKARLAGAAGKLSRPCFIADDERLVLPAFGSLTGGRNVLDPAIAGLFREGGAVYVPGERRVHAIARDHLIADPPDWRAHRFEDA